MGDYKQLNKELIDANRELKQKIATYQKELTSMRAELIELQRLRIGTECDCRDRMLSFATNNFKNFLSSLREIDTNINVMELLDYDNCVQNGSCNVGVSCQSEINEEESEDEVNMHRSGEGPTFMRQSIKYLVNLDMKDRQLKVNIVSKRGKQHHRRSKSENSIDIARNIEQDSAQKPSQVM
ncbi:uncharacterized protein LOC129243564 [Anastrepha obliqua]|uniref:uncharacterized protein LOC129243564 n=1 Tax=Anastrepha obliqua TaxID=95512 RepID=UPI0024097C8C|nr:uncharacterized protein LOC129243564 [Anastrepha obliqua]